MRIMLECTGSIEQAAITDRFGRFRFRFDPAQGRGGPCRVFASMPGVESSKVMVPAIYPSDDSVSVGTIRVSDGGPGIVSVTSAEAPKPARKKLKRGRRLAGRGSPDLEAAARELRAAVAEYERYAEAWLELGGVLEKLDRKSEALEAYGKAIEADPAFVPSYRPAIRLAYREEAVEKAAAWCREGVRVDPTLRVCEEVGRGR
jgi:tetratricopeptide (TPR) repeat protein